MVSRVLPDDHRRRESGKRNAFVFAIDFHAIIVGFRRLSFGSHRTQEPPVREALTHKEKFNLRHYEIVFIVHPDQSEQVPAMIERYRNTITAGQRHDAPHRGLGPAPAGATRSQKVFKAHYVLMNIEVAQRDARRARARVQVQRRGAAPPHRRARREAETGPSPMMKEEKSRNVTDGPAGDKPAAIATAQRPRASPRPAWHAT